MEFWKGMPEKDRRATMVFVLHNHQPAGNFAHVFRESFDRCYRPTLDLLWQYPDLHASLHYTGPLLEWIEVNEPGFLDLLRKMVERGQVEVIGGGFYEPIFCWLRSADQRRQVDLMRRHLEERLGKSGGGFWLAERVWETDLPARLFPLGLAYAPLDDHHFHLAGLDDEDLHGYYTVSWEGAPLRIFPISKDLLYLIPFRPVDQLLSFLDRRARGGACSDLCRRRRKVRDLARDLSLGLGGEISRASFCHAFGPVGVASRRLHGGGGGRLQPDGSGRAAQRLLYRNDGVGPSGQWTSFCLFSIAGPGEAVF